MKLLRRQLFPSAERGSAGKLRLFCVCVVNAVMLYDALFILPPEQEETGERFCKQWKGISFPLVGAAPNPPDWRKNAVRTPCRKHGGCAASRPQTSEKMPEPYQERYIPNKAPASVWMCRKTALPILPPPFLLILGRADSQQRVNIDFHVL